MSSITRPATVPRPLAEPAVAPLGFEDVYEQMFPFVWRCARRLGVEPSAQDDVCQEVFVVVHRRLPEFKGDSSLKTWIFGIVSNVVQTHRRSQQRKEPAVRSGAPLVDPTELSTTAHNPTATHDPYEVAERQESVRAARELFLSLPEEKRVLLMLADLEDVPVTEIAEMTGTNLNTVYARLRAARSALGDAVRRYRAKFGGGAHG